MSATGNDNRVLYALVRFGDILQGHILLQPCEEGDCDGPWHESIVLRCEPSVTTVDDSGHFEVWNRPADERVVALTVSRRPQHPSPIGAELMAQLSTLGQV